MPRPTTPAPTTTVRGRCFGIEKTVLMTDSLHRACPARFIGSDLSRRADGPRRQHPSLSLTYQSAGRVDARIFCAAQRRNSAQPTAARLPRRIGAFEQRVQQHVTAGDQILRLGVLDLVVADAADTGHEDHRGRRDPGHVDCVVPGAADDVLVLVALRFGRLAYRADKTGVERGRWEVPEFLDRGFEVLRGSGGGARLAQLAVHRAQQIVFGVAEIDRKEYPAGDSVARIRADLDKADRR